MSMKIEMQIEWRWNANAEDPQASQTFNLNTKTPLMDISSRVGDNFMVSCQILMKSSIILSSLSQLLWD